MTKGNKASKSKKTRQAPGAKSDSSAGKTKRQALFETFEEVAVYLLNLHGPSLGLDRVEGKQKLKGASGTSWTIEGKAVRVDGTAFLVVECKRHKRALVQETIAGIVGRSADLGANGAFVVTSHGLQKGAETCANYEKLTLVDLQEASTITNYYMKILTQHFVGVADTRETFDDTPLVAVTANRKVEDKLATSDDVVHAVKRERSNSSDHRSE